MATGEAIPTAVPAKLKSPAVIWTAVLALIPLLIEWLQGDYFAGEDWVLLAVALLTITARFIEVYVALLRAQEASQAAGHMALGPAPRVFNGYTARPARRLALKAYLGEAIFG